MINKHYDFVVRKPHEAAKRLEELDAMNEKLQEERNWYREQLRLTCSGDGCTGCRGCQAHPLFDKATLGKGNERY
jgi:hypothetical protein